MTRRFIVNADDYGLSPGVSAGIREAHTTGLVTSTTVLVNAPEAGEMIRLAQEETPTLALGVHLNLTFGSPILPSRIIPSLVNAAGSFRERQDFIQHLNILIPHEIEAEWRAQIEAFLNTGAILDHLDSHHHVVLYHSELWKIYSHLGKEYQCGVRAPFPVDVPEDSVQSWLPAESLNSTKRTAMEILKDANIPFPNSFWGSFFDTSATLDQLLVILENLPRSVSEMMCHPGKIDKTLLTSSGYRRQRQTELDALTHQKALRTVEEQGIQLVSFRSAWSD